MGWEVKNDMSSQFQDPQNVHKIYFQTILMTFVCAVKIDINMGELIVSSFLLTSSLV